VSDEFTTVPFNVVPLNVPAGAMMEFEPALVIKPLALTVKFGIDVEEPKGPVVELTVANVIGTVPGPVAVASPVNAEIPPGHACAPRTAPLMNKQKAFVPLNTGVVPTVSDALAPGDPPSCITPLVVQMAIWPDVILPVCKTYGEIGCGGTALIN
jgi:hypothetical protein